MKRNILFTLRFFDRAMDQKRLKAMCNSVPGRYAFAFFQVVQLESEEEREQECTSKDDCTELNRFDRTIQEMGVMASLLQTGGPFRFILLKILRGGYNPPWKEAFFRFLSFRPTTWRFLSVVIKHQREHCLPEIMRLFCQLTNDFLKRESLVVYTPQSIDLLMQQRIESVLEKVFNKQLMISFKEQPSLLGGVVVQSDRLTIDASAEGQIKRIGGLLRDCFNQVQMGL